MLWTGRVGSAQPAAPMIWLVGVCTALSQCMPGWVKDGWIRLVRRCMRISVVAGRRWRGSFFSYEDSGKLA